MALIKCPECGNDVSNKAPFCPHCGVPVSSREAPATRLVISPKKISDNSPAADFMIVLAWILWVGGVVISIFKANTSSVFNWLIFISNVITYLVSGGFAYCFAELLKNIWVFSTAIMKLVVKDGDN